LKISNFFSLKVISPPEVVCVPGNGGCSGRDKIVINGWKRDGCGCLKVMVNLEATGKSG